MPKIAMLNQEGAKVGEIELSEAIFASEINESVLHLVVRSQLAAKRRAPQSAKTRGEVRGGGRKIYRQKGTGNARHHGNRAPQFTQGGVVFAPKPRDLCRERCPRRFAAWRSRAPSPQGERWRDDRSDKIAPDAEDLARSPRSARTWGPKESARGRPPYVNGVRLTCWISSAMRSSSSPRKRSSSLRGGLRVMKNPS